MYAEIISQLILCQFDISSKVNQALDEQKGAVFRNIVFVYGNFLSLMFF